MTAHEATLVSVFAADGCGGNVAPVVLDARDMSDDAMRAVAASHGFESAFVLPATEGVSADLRLRFFLPTGEVEMCGHATLGALWLLAASGAIAARPTRVQTASGIVRARIGRGDEGVSVEISQPAGTVTALSDVDSAAVLDVLGLARADVHDLPILNASTSRAKTLVPMRSAARLNALSPRFADMKAVCDAIGSTGLYPFAQAPGASLPVFEARQFPRASGYPEDAATGIAATALAFGLLRWKWIGRDTDGIDVVQGRAMGRPSRLAVRFERAADTDGPSGCWLGGEVVRQAH